MEDLDQGELTVEDEPVDLGDSFDDEPESEPVVDDTDADDDEDEISPDWLYESEPEQRSSEPQYQPPPQYPPQYPQQPPPQYQQQQRALNRDDYLRGIVDNPEQFIPQIIQTEAQRIAQAQIAQQMGPVAQVILQQQGVIDGVQQQWAYSAESEARGAIGSAYKNVLSKDEGFRSNPKMQKAVETQLKGMLNEARRLAQRGDYSMMNTIRNPAFGETLLAAARVLYGKKPSNKRAAIPKGAKSQGSKPRRSTRSVDLPPDMESALSRLGKGARDKYLKSLENDPEGIIFQEDIR